MGTKTSAKTLTRTDDGEQVVLHNGVDVLAEADRLWGMFCVYRQIRRLKLADERRPWPRHLDTEAERRRCQHTAPPFQGAPGMLVRTGSGVGMSGSAWSRCGSRPAGVALTIGRGSSAATKELIAHELAHVLTPDENHGVGFVAMLSDMLREGYGVDVPVAAMDGERRWRKNGAYVWDDVAIEAMTKAGL